uniref:Uncharacterized protein n=2 Tax=Sus scrofa TaxID=9823 RepID=A0A8D0UGE4_PIG
ILKRNAVSFKFNKKGMGNCFQTVCLYCDVLGMKILWSEEFDEGCKAACNVMGNGVNNGGT